MFLSVLNLCTNVISFNNNNGLYSGQSTFNGLQSPQQYSSTQLRSIGRQFDCKKELLRSPELIRTLKLNDIFYYRKRRGGRRVNKLGHKDNMKIRVHITHRREHNKECVSWPQLNRPRTLIPVKITKEAKPETSSSQSSSFPSLYVFNAASLAKPHALQQLEAELESFSTDVAVITETHFKVHHTDQFTALPGYNCIRRDRTGRRGGGVAIYIREHIPYNFITVKNDGKEYESVWINVSIDKNNFTICGIYHPPKPIYDTGKFKTFLHDNIDHFVDSESFSTLILAGDFNQLPVSEIETNTGLISLVKQPTRGNNNLDNILISMCTDFSLNVFKSAVKSDHSAIVMCHSSLNVFKKKLKKCIEYRVKSPKNCALFLNNLQCVNFEPVFSSNDTQTICDNLYIILQNLLNICFPLKTCTVSDCDPQFITGETKMLLRKRNSLMRKNKIEEATALSEKIGKLIIKFNSSRLKNVSSGSFDMWKEVKRLTGTAKQANFPDFLTADSLNEHYSGISTDLSYVRPCLHSEYSRPIVGLQETDSRPTWPGDSDIVVGLVTEFMVFNLLDQLKPTSAGPDNLPFWFLKLAAPVISSPLAYLINNSLLSGTVPKQWKTAVIHPIPKVTPITALSDMRPISVVSILSRMTERLLIRELRPAISGHDMLACQFAYRPTCSTTAALIAILSHITHLLETNTCVHVVSFDYSKAFDTLSHASVMSSLPLFNVPPQLQNWIENYLTDRSHHTLFSGKSSPELPINAGVVQGSVLGPTLFNLASSTLKPLSSENKYFRYADDGYLIVPGKNSHTIPDEIQHHAK